MIENSRKSASFITTSSVKNTQTNNTLQEAPAGNITIKYAC